MLRQHPGLIYEHLLAVHFLYFHTRCAMSPCVWLCASKTLIILYGCAPRQARPKQLSWSNGQNVGQNHLAVWKKKGNKDSGQTGKLYFKKWNLSREMRCSQGDFLPTPTWHTLKMQRWQGEKCESNAYHLSDFTSGSSTFLAPLGPPGHALGFEANFHSDQTV